MDGVNVKCVRRIKFSIVLKCIVFCKVFTRVRQTNAPLQWFYPVCIHASVSHLNQDCISIYAFFYFYKGFVLLRNSLRLHSKHQQIWLHVTRAMINVMEMIVSYAIKLFHIGAVTNCQIRRTAGLFRETCLKGIQRKIVGYVREWKILPCISEVLLIRFGPI